MSNFLGGSLIGLSHRFLISYRTRCKKPETNRRKIKVKEIRGRDAFKGTRKRLLMFRNTKKKNTFYMKPNT